MERFKLTRDHINGANCYLPLEAKMAFVRKNAERCFDRLRITAGDDNPMPPMYMENAALKKRYLMTALVRDYLRLACETEAENEDGTPGDLMTVADYDKWAGCHLFMQIERMKKERGELCDRCYDLLADYSELCRMMDAQIRGLLTVQNDYVTRQQLLNREVMAELPKVAEALKDLQARRAVTD